MQVNWVQLGGKFTKKSLTKAGDTTVTVPAAHRYVLVLGGGKYVADATVATRTFTVYCDSGAGSVEVWLAYLSSITASQTKRIALGRGASTGIDLYAELPSMGLILPAAYRLLVGVGNAQAGDTWELDLYYADLVVGT